MPLQLYTMRDFMEYPELAFKMAFFEPFVWSGNLHRHQATPQLRLKHFISVFAAVSLVVEMCALVLNLFVPFKTAEAEAFENTESRIFEATALVCYFSCGFYKMWNVYWRRGDIGRLLEEFKELFPSEIKQRVLAEANGLNAQEDEAIELKRGSGGRYRFAHYNRKSRILMRRVTQYFMFAYSYYNIIPVIQLFYEIFSPNLNIMYKTQANSWYPWHNHNYHTTFIGFIISFLWQAFAELFTITFIMCNQYLFAFFTTQLELHLDYVASATEKLDASNPDAVVELKRLISYHNHLMCLFKKLNDIFNFTITLDLINCTFAISLMGLAMVMINIGGAIMFSCGLMFFLVTSYVFCLCGNDLTSVSQTLSSSIFNSNWYEGTPEYRRLVSFFIVYAMDPVKYQAYGYMELSMETYMKMLKLSYQLFTAFHATE